MNGGGGQMANANIPNPFDNPGIKFVVFLSSVCLFG